MSKGNDLLLQTPIKYELENVNQCWNCANCVGYKTVTFTDALVVHHPNFVKDFISIGGKDFLVMLPECKKTGCYMTFVYNKICEKWEKKK